MCKDIDNSALLPRYVPDSKVSLEDSGNGLKSPDWVKSLIIEQVNVASASPDGKFSGMPFVLKHLAQTGVNCVWITPVFGGKHYLNFGPKTLLSSLTGTEDYEEGLKVVKDFVDTAHRFNIRVLFDVVTWGANPEAPVCKEHPDWFCGFSEEYRGKLYDWQNKDFFNWFVESLVDLIRKTGADGYRADCSIEFCGPELYKKVREILHNEGRYIAIIGEAIAEGTQFFFDFNEHSIDYFTQKEGTKFIAGEINFPSGYRADMIAAVKQGRGLDTRRRQADGTAGQLRFYSSIVSCHDSRNYTALGRTMAMVYSSILSPFIPMWYIGEEWNNPYTGKDHSEWLYANKINWEKLSENHEFFEKVKKAIRIRRLLPEIFENFPINHREINFCSVKTDQPDILPAYARPWHGYGIIVVPNDKQEEREFNFFVPVKEFGLSENAAFLTADLMTGEIFGKGNILRRKIAAGDTGVYFTANEQKINQLLSVLLYDEPGKC